MVRRATTDVELAEVRIAAGTLVIVNTAAANRDPAVYPDPDRFDITRDAVPAMLTFGGGAHYCLGAALARLEARTLLTHLLKRFPDLALASGPAYAPRMVFRRMTSLKVTT